MHVSTAYCNCDRTEVCEVIYSPPYKPDEVISLVNWLPEDMLDKVKCDTYMEVECSYTVIILSFRLDNTIADWKATQHLYVYKSIG